MSGPDVKNPSTRAGSRRPAALHNSMGSRPLRRIPAAISAPVAFGGYLVVAAGLTMVRPGRPAGVVALLVIAALVGWWTTVPGAVGAGLLGWPFYAGFVTHADGVLGLTGRQDAVVVGALLAAAGSAVAVRAVFARLPRSFR